ncbi:MAG TPA: hypothetical protein VET46_03460 [Steroidobacteraceae bacterium]|nr:hypothetical protein [Steroidobacteraceae bacterium]
MSVELEQEPAVARLLRELPEAAAGPYDFGEFQRRARSRPAGAARMANARALVATAVIAVAVCATATRLGPIGRPLLPHPATAAAQPGEAAVSGNDEAYGERWLSSLPREPALVHVGTRSAVETLEDDIAQVDDLVSAARAGSTPAMGVEPLLAERAQLVNSLVQVRYAESLADVAR